MIKLRVAKLRERITTMSECVRAGKRKLHVVSVKDMPRNLKLLLLRELRLEVDESGFITKNGKRVIDRYVGRPVQIDNMAIFPSGSGAPVVLDDNILSIASYIEEFGEFEDV